MKQSELIIAVGRELFTHGYVQRKDETSIVSYENLSIEKTL